MERIMLISTTDDTGQRLDQYLTGKLPQYSRNYFQNLIREGLVLVDEKLVKSNYRIKTGEHILVMIPPEKEMEVIPEKIELDIIYDDQDIAIINKPEVVFGV